MKKEWDTVSFWRGEPGPVTVRDFHGIVAEASEACYEKEVNFPR